LARGKNIFKKSDFFACIRKPLAYLGGMSTTLLQGQAAQPIQVGDIVENFSAVVRVDEIHPEYGLRVTIVPWVKNGIQQGGVGQRYYADASKCRVICGSEPVYKHKDGLVCFA
jgi:hypothetical protein